MPELPDISLYLDALRERIRGRRLERARVTSPFLLRSVEPRIDDAVGQRVADLRRLGKRVAIGFENDLWLVIHLMIAGRFQWRPAWPDKTTKVVALVLGFDNGTLLLTEAGTKKRASLYVVRGASRLAEHDPGGLEIADASAREFLAALRSGNHTLKRALTDPRLLSGIGNAYSDEILHRARLSPVMLTSRLTDEQGERLHRATLDVLAEWTKRLREQSARRVPEQGHGVSRRDGRARALRLAVPRVRYESAAHPLCRQRDELLPALPDRRQAARRPLVVAAAEARLAEVDRRARAIA